MNKISISIDLTKIDKTRIKERTYTNRENVEVTVKDYDLDVVELKQPRVVTKSDGSAVEGDTWRLMETHFVCEAQSKEEREANKETVYVGKGTQFEDKGSPASTSPAQEVPAGEQPPAPDDIPF